MENIDNCKNSIHDVDKQRAQEFRTSRQGVLRGIYSQKYLNRHRLNNKLTRKMRRKSLETQVLEMKKTLHLMEKKYHQTHLDAETKQKAIKAKREVTYFKNVLQDQKIGWYKKKRRMEVKSRNDGIMDKEATTNNKIHKMQTILNKKKVLVKKKKAQYEINCERRQFEKMEELKRKAESANRIRLMKKKAKNNRVKFFQKKYKFIKNRIRKDIKVENNRIQTTRKLARELLDYGVEINQELRELEKYHSKVEKEFYKVGDIVCRYPAGLLNMDLKLNGDVLLTEGDEEPEQSMSHHPKEAEKKVKNVMIASQIAPPEEDFAYLPDMDEHDYKEYLNSDNDD